jgi:hypothetical protein
MSDPLSNALRQNMDPDEEYAAAFRNFRALFRLKPDADVSRIQLPSYLTDGVYVHPEILGAVITGAGLACSTTRRTGVIGPNTL